MEDQKIKPESITILMADDDPDDRLLAKKAFKQNRLYNEVVFVEDGEQLMEYLLDEKNQTNNKLPGLILLDLNMPKKDGREALKEIKSHQNLRKIPVVVLTTSTADEDIIRSYDLGVNSFISKPVTFDELVKVTKEIGNYWFKLVRLPNID